MKASWKTPSAKFAANFPVTDIAASRRNSNAERCIRGWYLDRSLEQSLTQTALCKALENHVPEIHHSDQGVQYAANLYVELLEGHAVKISMAEVGEPTQNGYAERLMRTIKEEG